MSDNDSSLPDLRYVRELARVFRTYGLDEVEIENGSQRILMRRGGEGGALAPAIPQTFVPPPLAAAPAPAARAPAHEELDEVAAASSAGDFITSPFVGTYYSRPNPTADVYLKVGDTIAAGQTVCIVEAMKLFNEIEADFACVVEQALVSDGDGVEFGTKLFRVRRL